MALLELDGVVAYYGAVSALHGVTMSVEEGSIVAILGADGAGKTTTLRAISAGRDPRRPRQRVSAGGRLSRKPPLGGTILRCPRGGG
jgi:ABC-type branched-subunit amino acid transport system ATPase component